MLIGVEKETAGRWQAEIPVLPGAMASRETDATIPMKNEPPLANAFVDRSHQGPRSRCRLRRSCRAQCIFILAALFGGCSSVTDLASREPELCEVHGAKMEVRFATYSSTEAGELRAYREHAAREFPHHGKLRFLLPADGTKAGYVQWDWRRGLVVERRQVRIRFCQACDDAYQRWTEAETERKRPRAPIPERFRVRTEGAIAITVLGTRAGDGVFFVPAGTRLRELLRNADTDASPIWLSSRDAMPRRVSLGRGPSQTFRVEVGKLLAEPPATDDLVLEDGDVLFFPPCEGF